MAAMEDACVARIKETVGADLSEAEIREIIGNVRRKQRRIMRESPLIDNGEAMMRAATEVGDEEKLAALIEKRSRAINVLRKNENLRYLKANFANRESRGLQALMVGIEGKEQGAALSQDAMGKGIGLGYLGGFVNELRQRGVLGYLTEGALIRAGQLIGLFKDRANRYRQLERDLTQELFNITEPDRAIHTNNPKAKEIAEVLHKYQNLAVKDQNDAGAWIGKIAGYIVRQSHDQLKIRGRGTDADFVKWRDFILPKLDERTFDDVPDEKRNDFLLAVWQALSSGIHDRPQGDWLGGFKGPGNLAKRVSQERVLHFKDAMSWFDYNEQYGHGSVLEAAIHGLLSAGRTVAALRTWGTNPEAAFNRMREEFAAAASKRNDFAEADRLQGKGRFGDTLRNQFNAVNGHLGMAESPTLARQAANVRALITMAKLGGVVISSLPDIANSAAVLKHNGLNLFERYQEAVFGTILRGPLDAEKREVVDLMGTALDGMLGGIVGRFSAQDHFAGKVTKMQDVFFRLNLLGFWTDRMKEGISLALARKLAIDAPKAFDALHPRQQITLGRYKIDAPTWDLIRKAVSETEDGRSYLLPDVAERISDEDMAKWAGLPDDAPPKALDRARFDLTSRLRSYFVEQVREGMTEPGAKERAVMSFGTKPGTAAGELVRSLTMFRTFSYTFLSRNIGREIYRAPDKVGAAVNVAWLIAATTVLGALSNAASDLVKGRTPRDPRDNPFGVAGAAMLKGGGLGLYGDFLLGTSNRFGQSFGETVLGPVFGEASDIKKILDAAAGKVVGKDQGDPGAMLYRFALGNTPFINLFYTRLALDYLVNFQIQEMLNPGFLRRMESRMKKDNNQRFLIAPSSVIPYGGGNRLFEGVRQ